MAHMVVDFPKMKSLDCPDQYMFGRDLWLPDYRGRGGAQEIYLPEGLGMTFS